MNRSIRSTNALENVGPVVEAGLSPVCRARVRYFPTDRLSIADFAPPTPGALYDRAPLENDDDQRGETRRSLSTPDDVVWRGARCCHVARGGSAIHRRSARSGRVHSTGCGARSHSHLECARLQAGAVHVASRVGRCPRGRCGREPAHRFSRRVLGGVGSRVVPDRVCGRRDARSGGRTRGRHRRLGGGSDQAMALPAEDRQRGGTTCRSSDS